MADWRVIRARLRAARHRLAGASAAALVLGVWAGVTLILALGCLLLIGVLVADGHPARFFLHARNLANHYLAAGPLARIRFHAQLGAIYAGLVLLLGTARAPSLVKGLRETLARERRHD